MLCFLNMIVSYKGSFKNAWVNRKNAMSIVKKYSPQIVNQDIFSSIGVNNYAKSIILLSDNSKECGAIVQLEDDEKINLLIYFTEYNDLCIEHVLWSPLSEKESSLNSFVNYLKLNNLGNLKIKNQLLTF